MPSNYDRKTGRPDPAFRETLNDLLGLKPPTVCDNKAGITNNMELIRYEAMVTSVTIPMALKRIKNTRKWELKHWRIAHRIIFSEVYDWAGQLRTTDITKQRTKFVPYERVAAKAEIVFNNFHHAHAINGDIRAGLRQKSDADLAGILSDLYSDLNAIHPFREGNGRSLKTLCTAIARQAGRSLDWSLIAHEKYAFDHASEAGALYNDNRQLKTLFATIIEPADTRLPTPSSQPRLPTPGAKVSVSGRMTLG